MSDDFNKLLRAREQTFLGLPGAAVPQARSVAIFGAVLGNLARPEP